MDKNKKRPIAESLSFLNEREAVVDAPTFINHREAELASGLAASETQHVSAILDDTRRPKPDNRNTPLQLWMLASECKNFLNRCRSVAPLFHQHDRFERCDGIFELNERQFDLPETSRRETKVSRRYIPMHLIIAPVAN